MQRRSHNLQQELHNRSRCPLMKVDLSVCPKDQVRRHRNRHHKMVLELHRNRMTQPLALHNRMEQVQLLGIRHRNQPLPNDL